MSHPSNAGDRDHRPAPDSSAPTRPDYEAIAERCEAAADVYLIAVHGDDLDADQQSSLFDAVVTACEGCDFHDSLSITGTPLEDDERDLGALLARCQWLEGQVAKQAAVIEGQDALIERLRLIQIVDELRRDVGESP